jgi:hypothetical protein
MLNFRRSVKDRERNADVNEREKMVVAVKTKRGKKSSLYVLI